MNYGKTSLAIYPVLSAFMVSKLVISYACLYVVGQLCKYYLPMLVFIFFFCRFSLTLGEQWREFRSRVQKPVLQLSTVRRYVKPLEKVTDDFLARCTQHLLDEKNELPHDFSNEIHKWSLECIGLVALDTRFGCLDKKLDPKSEPQQIINAAQFVLRNIAILELKAPYWRWFPSISPMWKRYVANMDYFVE